MQTLVILNTFCKTNISTLASATCRLLNGWPSQISINSHRKNGSSL